MYLKNSPMWLLLVTGGFLGLNFPLGKLANDASVSPVVWAWLISAGAGMVLFVVLLLSGKRVSLRRNYLKYYVLSSVCSLVVPNILIFTVIPKLGSGFTGILFTLSPIFTLGLSSLWQVHLPTRLGVVGIVVGFAGAIIVTLTRGEVSQPAGLGWILAGLCIPISLAIGNIYRTICWPKGGDPLALSVGSNLTAAMLLFIVAITTGPISAFQGLLVIKEVALAQVIASTIMFSVFFRLQQVGGPTYLSQIGYVAAGVALFAGTLFLGERYSVATWLGAAVIVAGVGFSVVAQQQKKAANH
jgi:drug/metabolite transporter (DMT)-like permease